MRLLLTCLAMVLQSGSAAEYSCVYDAYGWPKMEIKGGVCNGTKFIKSFPMCRDDSSPVTPSQEIEALGTVFALSQDECLALTAGTSNGRISMDHSSLVALGRIDLQHGSLEGAEYLNAAAVCPQIGGTSNATGFCSVGPGGTFCDWLQSATYSAVASCSVVEEYYESTDTWTEMSETTGAPVCRPEQVEKKLCCDSRKEITGDISFGLPDLIWVTPGSAVSEYLDTTKYPHKWSPLCTDVDEAKFAVLIEEMISSGKCSRDRDNCQPVMLWQSIDRDGLINSVMGSILGVLAVMCIGCIVGPYFCCGTFRRNLQELAVMKQYEHELQRAVEQSSVSSRSELAAAIDKVQWPTGRVGCTRFEKNTRIYCGLSCSLASFIVALIMAGVWSGLTGGNLSAAKTVNDLMVAGFLVALFCLICIAAYVGCGCCGGGGFRRQRDLAEPPLAVLVANESIAQGHHVDEAQLRTQSLMERMFLPVHVAEDLVYLSFCFFSLRLSLSPPSPLSLPLSESTLLFFQSRLQARVVRSLKILILIVMRRNVVPRVARRVLSKLSSLGHSAFPSLSLAHSLLPCFLRDSPTSERLLDPGQEMWST